MSELVQLSACELHVEAINRGGFGDIQGLALWNALGNVKQDHVAQLFQSGQMGQCATDHTRTDQCNLVASHVFSSFYVRILKGFAPNCQEKVLQQNPKMTTLRVVKFAPQVAFEGINRRFAPTIP